MGLIPINVLLIRKIDNYFGTTKIERTDIIFRMKGVDSLPIQNSRFMSLEKEDKCIIESTHNQIQTSICFSP